MRVRVACDEEDDGLEREDARAQDLEYVKGLAQPRRHVERVPD